MFAHWLGIYITNYTFLYIKYEEGFQELFCCFEKIHLVIYALLLLLCCCCCFFFFIHLESWKATRSMNITSTDMTYNDKDMSACNKECLPWACVKFDCWTWMVFHCWLCSIFFLSSSLTVFLSLCDMLKLFLPSSHTSKLAFFFCLLMFRTVSSQLWVNVLCV